MDCLPSSQNRLNNYGPYQFPERLIPLTILNAIEGKPLPVYCRGENIRDWLYVEDHAAALMSSVQGNRGSYNIGGHKEKRNIDVVNAVCDILDDATGPHGFLSPADQFCRRSARP